MLLFAPLEASDVVGALSEGAPDARAQLDAVLALAAVRRVELVRGTKSTETRPLNLDSAGGGRVAQPPP